MLFREDVIHILKVANSKRSYAFKACVTSHEVKTFNVSLEFASIIEN